MSLVERSAVVLGLSSSIAGGGHSTGTGALSCAVDGTGPTFDTVMAPRLQRTTPEVGASSSMRDHTAILFMSDNGEQHHSTGREWPLLLVGGNALGDGSLDHFRLEFSTRIAPGPLSELYG